MPERLPLKKPQPAADAREAADFFMIWTRTGWGPRKPHDTFGDAANEAARLAARHPGKQFVVLKAVAKFHVPSRLTPPVTKPASPPETDHHDRQR